MRVSKKETRKNRTPPRVRLIKRLEQTSSELEQAVKVETTPSTESQRLLSRYKALTDYKEEL